SSWLCGDALWRRERRHAVSWSQACEELRHLTRERRSDDCVSGVVERRSQRDRQVLLQMSRSQADARSPGRRCCEASVDRDREASGSSVCTGNGVGRQGATLVEFYCLPIRSIAVFSASLSTLAKGRLKQADSTVRREECIAVCFRRTSMLC